MLLRIMFNDKTVKECFVERLFPTNQGKHLYFETPSDVAGKGQTIDLSTVKCWEAVAHVPGGSHGLKL